MLPLELVSIVNDVPKTTSLIVAEYFEKKHQHVMEKIRSLLSEVPSDFNQSNFRLVDYIDAKGEVRPCYEMTKDGFTLLAMGFTGKKAIEFKINYINAFNNTIAVLSQRNNSLMYQYNKVSFDFNLASQNASEAGRALNYLGKQVKPSMRERLEQLEKQMQMVLNFTNEKADTVHQDEMSAYVSTI